MLLVARHGRDQVRPYVRGIDIRRALEAISCPQLIETFAAALAASSTVSAAARPSRE
jgi:hypothetical protein